MARNNMGRASAGLLGCVLLLLLLLLQLAGPGLHAVDGSGLGAPDDSDNLQGEAGSLDQGDPEVTGIKFQMVFGANITLGYNHMAMVEWLPERSRLVVAWQAARASEGSNSQVLLTARSDDMGSSWTEPAELQRMPEDPPGVLWSPVLHRISSNELLLFYSESTACLRPAKEKNGVVTGEPRWNPGGDIKVAVSSDGGESWGQRRMVYAQSEEGGIPKVIANRIHLVEGAGAGSGPRLLLPFWRERARGAKETQECPALSGGGHETSGVLISDDRGRSWRAAGKVADPSGSTWLIEGTIAAGSDGSLLMLLRSAADAVWASRSEDLGLSWSTPFPLHLPNPNSKLSAISATNWPGAPLLAALNHHPRLRGDHARTRSQLSLVTSEDGGRAWHLLARLEDAMSPGNWYHYPTVLEISRDLVVVAYSAQHTAEGRDGIKLALVSLSQAQQVPSGRRLFAAGATDPEWESMLSLQESAFSASSSHSHCKAAWAGLHGLRCWCAATLDSHQWLQVDLGQLTNVTHIATAGRPDSRSDQRVTSYAISFSRNGWTWDWYRAGLPQGAVEEVVLTGNRVRGEVKVNALVGHEGLVGIPAKAIRIHPVRWMNHISMQVAFFSGETAPVIGGGNDHDEL